MFSGGQNNIKPTNGAIPTTGTGLEADDGIIEISAGDGSEVAGISVIDEFVPAQEGLTMAVRERPASSSPSTRAPSYMDIVNRTPASRYWFYYLSNVVPSRIAAMGARAVSDALVETFCSAGPNGSYLRLRPSNFQQAEVAFCDDPEIEYIVGQKLLLPVVSFRDVYSFLRFVTNMGVLTPMQGLSVDLPFERFLTNIGIAVPRGLDISPLKVIVYCKMQIPQGKPPKQIARHEKIHAIDPLLYARRAEPDGLVLTEMIATIGEFASLENDIATLNTSEEFWLSYLAKCRAISSSLLRMLKIDPYGLAVNLELVARGIVDLIKRLTLTRSNTELVRSLMGCVSFEEVQRKLAMEGSVLSRDHQAPTSPPVRPQMPVVELYEPAEVADATEGRFLLLILTEAHQILGTNSSMPPQIMYMRYKAQLARATEEGDQKRISLITNAGETIPELKRYIGWISTL